MYYNANMYTYIVPKMQENECTTNKWYYSSDTHIHQDWEFTTTTKGMAKNIINNVPYENVPDTFLLLGPNHTHAQKTKGGIIRRDICISTSLFIQFCNSIKQGLYEELNASKEPIQIHLPTNTYQEIVTRLEAVDVYKTTNPTDEAPILRSIIAYLLGLYIEQSHLNSKRTSPTWFSDFMHKIQEPEYFTRKIEELAKEANYSHAHLLTIFKQETGRTLISYITAQRMNYASKLLINTNLPIIQIANQVGYDNHSFFTQKFKEYFHSSPTAYRKKHTKPFSTNADA